MDSTELKKTKMHVVSDIIKYVPNTIINKTILKKTRGTVTISSFAEGEELVEKSSAFDNYVHIIDGAAEITIEKKKYNLKSGEGIIIPARAKHTFNALEQFKMISTIIKSGYED